MKCTNMMFAERITYDRATKELTITNPLEAIEVPPDTADINGRTRVRLNQYLLLDLCDGEPGMELNFVLSVRPPSGQDGQTHAFQERWRSENDRCRFSFDVRTWAFVIDRLGTYELALVVNGDPLGRVAVPFVQAKENTAE